jgi:hypothetical protein
VSAATIAVIFLTVSYIGFFVQLASLIRLVSQLPEPTKSASLAHHGIVRTSFCRVSAAILYIFIGTNALFFQLLIPVVTLGTFCAVQILWMVNGRMDVRLKKRIAAITASTRSATK